MSETEKIKIYYLASGHISIPILKAIMAAENLELVGIGSQQKVAKGTGPVRSAKSPLTQYCNANGIQIDGYATVNTDEFLGMLRERGVELLVVASFGQILKQPLLDTPKFGCLNVHASLLPRFRGASPIVAALMNGDSKTGVSFMQMEAGLDTGAIYRKVELQIEDSDNADILEERLGVLAGLHIEQVIIDIVRNGLKPVPQAAEGATYAKKINKEDGWINWNRPALELANMVRAYFPWPSARALMPVRNNSFRMAKITKGFAVENSIENAKPGDIIRADKDGIVVACGQGALVITRLLPEGKKEMAADDYLRGYPVPSDHRYMYLPQNG